MIKDFVFYETAKEKVGPGFQVISQCLLPEDAQFERFTLIITQVSPKLPYLSSTGLFLSF